MKMEDYMRDNEFLQAAVERMKKEAEQVSGQKEKAMAGPVREALENFCRQEPEFAQAIVQGGSFADCMKAVAKGVGYSISDSEAFAKAARFYFPGCRVQVVMKIDLIGAAGDDSPANGSGPQLVKEQPGQKQVAVKLLDLNDLFDDAF